MRDAPDPAPARRSFGEWLSDAFGVDDPWVRPRPPIERRDVVLAGVVAVVGVVSLELARSLGMFEDVTGPVWLQTLAVLSGAALLVGRRRWPLTVGLLAAVHMVVVGVAMPMVMGQFTLQVAYFVAFLSAVAWARDRRAMVAVMGVIVVVMFAWIALQFAVGNSIQEIIDETAGVERTGLLGPIPSAVLLTLIINVIYFGSAIAGGQILWRDARQKAQLREQAETITAQAEDLRDQAITEERLRIARELHDVVAHHVSVIGVQAAAARRVLAHDPAAAAPALSAIESSSREAVSSMRGLLGTLRHIRSRRDEPDNREPEPSIDQLPTLAAAHETANRTVAYRLVQSRPDAAASVPAPVGHSIYRTVQEALANVGKHSTATRVSVVVRIESEGRPYAEVEVVDNGRPRGGSTLGSGLGQLGIRERAASHRGVVDIGPRAGGGYRVRVRYPLDAGAEQVA
ncbi:MAG: histidine kinase [Dermatophilaceae bacterium]